MKKSILGILIIIVIAIGAAPYVNGLMMEKVLLSQLARVNQLYADHPFAPSLTINRYQRGYGSSEIEWSISIPQLENHADVEPIILTENAQHGYLGVSSTTSLNQNSWYRDFITQQLNGQDPFSITSRYDLLSGVTVTMGAEPFELRNDHETPVVIHPAKLVITTDRALKHLTTAGRFDGFSIPGKLDLQGISLQSDTNIVSSLIMDGQSSVSIQQLNLIDNQGQAIQLSALNGTSIVDFDPTHNKLSMNTTYSVEQVVKDTETVNDIRLSVAINQLDGDGLEQIYNVYSDMISAMMANLEPQNDPELAQALLEQQMALAGIQLMAEMEKLLKKDLQLKISDLHMALPQGEVSGDFALGLKKDMTLASFAVLAQQPQQLVEVFSFASNFSLPAGLMKGQEQLLMPLFPGMQSGVFEKSGERLVHQAEIAGDKLVLNGKEVVLR